MHSYWSSCHNNVHPYLYSAPRKLSSPQHQKHPAALKLHTCAIILRGPLFFQICLRVGGRDTYKLCVKHYTSVGCNSQRSRERFCKTWVMRNLLTLNLFFTAGTSLQPKVDYIETLFCLYSKVALKYKFWQNTILIAILVSKLLRKKRLHNSHFF